MTVKIKVTVDPPENAPFGYHKETFFFKVPDYVYKTMIDVAAEGGTDIQTVFTKWIEASLKEYETILSQEKQ